MADNKKYKAAYSGNIYNTKAEAIADNVKYLKEKKERDLEERYNQKANEFNKNSPIVDYEVPFIPEKRITLTNAGRATGATFSTNLLDSIAVNAKKAGLDLKTAIGLVTKESTLGNPTYDLANRAKISSFEKERLDYGREDEGDDYNEFTQEKGNRNLKESTLVNYNKSQNPYAEALNYAYNKSWSKEDDTTDWDKYYSMLEQGEAYADQQAKKRLAQRKVSVLQKAFSDYKNNPKGYNPGQRNYVDLVNKRAEEVWNSPQVQAWWRIHNNDY